MARPAAVLLVLAVALAAIRGAPNVKDPPKGPAYLATTVGATWVYTFGCEEAKRVVTAVEEKGGRTVVSIGRPGPDGQLVPSEVLAVSRAGVTCLGVDGVALDPPATMLKLPFADGATWKMDAAGPAPVGTWTGTLTATGPVEVKVPAGTYQAIRVEWDCVLNGNPIKSTLWYAADIGVVKMAYGDNQAMELKSFSPGK